MIGAGSVVFCKTLIQDILLFPEFAKCEFALMDIDPERLWVSEKMAHKVAEATKTNPTIKAYSDRRAALDGADYCINMIQVGGYKPSTLIDFEVPKKHGLKQTIGDTLGIGGIFRSLRTIPVMLDMCRDMEELCPNVQFLNYTNPMGINTGAMLRGTKIRTVGLCHGIQGASHTLARYAGIPYEELTFIAAGINHCSWFIKLEHKGKDLYPLIIEKARKGELPEVDQVRIEMMLRLGYYGGESPEHLSEYLPYFIRRDRPDLLETFHVPIDEYPRRCEKEIAWWQQHKKDMADDKPIEVREKSHEYGSLIIHSIETNTPRVVYGNVLNKGLITNLPANTCVEVPCLVDNNGIQATVVGDLPPQVRAVVQTNVNVQDLTIQACLTRKKEYAYHAAMFDPHTCAELTLDEIWSLVDDLFEAHGDYIPAMD